MVTQRNWLKMERWPEDFQAGTGEEPGREWKGTSGQAVENISCAFLAATSHVLCRLEENFSPAELITITIVIIITTTIFSRGRSMGRSKASGPRH